MYDTEEDSFKDGDDADNDKLQHLATQEMIKDIMRMAAKRTATAATTAAAASIVNGQLTVDGTMIKQETLDVSPGTKTKSARKTSPSSTGSTCQTVTAMIAAKRDEVMSSSVQGRHHRAQSEKALYASDLIWRFQYCI